MDIRCSSSQPKEKGDYQMSASSRLLSLLAAMFAICLIALPAHAQATRTWVSGVGNDADPCSRTAPCKTFAGAISKTALKGEINCLDPGGFGAVTITKSITISCEVGTAGVLVSGTNGIVVSVTSTDIVVLRGLDFEGLTTGLSGINFIGAGVLHVENCLIRGFNAGSAAGINMAPTGASELYVSDSTIIDNGNGASGAGILMTPSGASSVNAVLSSVRINNNNAGIKIDGTIGNGSVNLSLIDSVSAGNGVGSGVAVVSTAGHVTSVVMINRSTLSNNGFRLRGDGPLSTARIGSSVIAGNSTGVASVNGATLQSYGNNQINGNTTDGSISTTALH
jgi:hypothetical protein